MFFYTLFDQPVEEFQKFTNKEIESFPQTLIFLSLQPNVVDLRYFKL